MKRKLTVAISASVIGLSIAVSPWMPVSAQTNNDNTGSSTGTTTTDTTTYRNDNNFDWGWLGLLGLLGLGGLAGRNRHEEPVRYRDPNTVGSTTSRE